jgi:SAM-dependent methyltransferase
MLLKRAEVLAMLRCPISGSKLSGKDGTVTTLDSEENRVYPVIQGYPVLIDFEESVLRHEDIRVLDSIVKRPAYEGLSGVVKKVISPPKKTTANNVKKFLDLLLHGEVIQNPVVLIIGGGTIGQGMNCFYLDPKIRVVAFDIYGSSNVQFIADAHHIPLADESVDAVVIQAVLEHVLEPNQVVSEIYRVLKQDGIVYAETPFLQHVHEGAYDFTRYTESGHRYLFKNFELIRSGASAGAGTQLLWSIDNFFRGLFRSRKIGKIIKLCFFWLRYVDSAIPETYNVDAASGVFFLGRKSSSSISRQSLVDHYRGAQG